MFLLYLILTTLTRLVIVTIKELVTVQPSAEPLQAAPIFKVDCSEMGAALNSFTYSLMTNQQVIGHG